MVEKQCLIRLELSASGFGELLSRGYCQELVLLKPLNWMAKMSQVLLASLQSP